MSSFIVNEKCLVDILTLVKEYNKEILIGFTDNDFLNKLYKMNCDAYAKRYNECTQYALKNFTEFESDRHELTKLFNLIAYIYQCSELDILDYELYKQLKKLGNELMTEFDQKYIMQSVMTHSRNFNASYEALQIYMERKNIRFLWGS